MVWLRAALLGLVGVNAVATAHSLVGIAGFFPFDNRAFLLWLLALTIMNVLLLAAVRRRWSNLGLRGQAVSLLWGGVALWYWTVAPLYYLLTVNLNSEQLTWTAFAFFWEVPVIGAGLFVSASLRLLSPLTGYIDRQQKPLSPARLYAWTLRYPVVVSGLLAGLSFVGYAVGSAQVAFFADLSALERAKGVLNGVTIAVFLGIFFYLIFDALLGRVRGQLRRDFPEMKVRTRTLATRVVVVAVAAIVGGLGLISLAVFSVLQALLAPVSDAALAAQLFQPAALGRFGAGAGLVLALTVGVMVFMVYMLSRALRSLTNSALRADVAPEHVALLYTGDEIESLSHAFANTITALAGERDRLQESRLRSDAIFDSLGEGVVVTDRKGMVVRLNKQAAQLIGWTSEEIIGQTWLSLVRPADDDGEELPKDKMPLNVALRTGKTIHERSLLYTRRDGSALSVSVTAAAVPLRGRVVGAVLVFRDITEEKAVDKAKTEFVSLASHQLRTPLTAINWYIEMLLQHTDGEHRLSEGQRRDLARVSVRSRHMIEVVNDLLNVSRLETGRLAIRPKPTDLPALIRGVIDELQVMARQFACEVIFHKGEEIPHNVLIDQGLLRQVLHNILTNAIKYSKRGQGSRVWVELEQDDQAGYLISVQDEGVGIPAAVQARIFDKFIRAENVMKMETEGSGLGLYVVKMVMEACGAEVWFESAEGKGTTFYVRIPPEGMQERAGGVGLAELGRSQAERVYG